jgi:hypothetical protein
MTSSGSVCRKPQLISYSSPFPNQLSQEHVVGPDFVEGDIFEMMASLCTADQVIERNKEFDILNPQVKQHIATQIGSSHQLERMVEESEAENYTCRELARTRLSPLSFVS